MIARIRKAKEEDQGFTLVELLVVMIIIGILAAIAIPVFLNQRKAAVDTSMKSDLRSAANEVETFFVANQLYPDATQWSATVLPAIELSSGTTLTYKPGTNAYCLSAANGGGTQGWVYQSDNGGLQPNTLSACP